MGMNVIRFYLNYKFFEDDASPYRYKNTGWIWLDQNIAWAKKYGVYLVLNMHTPQGGYQSQGRGDALWQNTENQNRLAALWKAIAGRYKDEPQILGFGPVNEPIPTSNISQWQQLSQRLANEIRTVNKNHILFIERAISVKGQSETPDLNFPLINDSNTAYEFHFYDPFLYTHQLFSWANTGDGGKYPDESVVSLANATWHTAIFNNPALPTGNTNWTFFEGVRYTVSDPLIKAGVPALVGANVGAGGRVFFDDIVIREYDPAGNLVRTIWDLPLGSMDGWSYWSANNSGSPSLATNTGVSSGNSLSIQGSTGDCNLSNYSRLFIAKQGFSYQVSGYMRGENVSAAAACRLRIDFLRSPDPVMARNRELLDAAIKPYVDWARRKNVPLFLGEYGAGNPCFQDNKGGLIWVSDMIDLIRKYNIPAWTYHSYHEDSFGLYFGYGRLPDPANANQALIELFRQKLK
jgi:endoglucanase